MAKRQRIDTSAYTTFGQITERLEEIVVQVKRKDVPLESSLDLFDEAIALGSKAVDFVDTAEVLPNENSGTSNTASKSEDAAQANES